MANSRQDLLRIFVFLALAFLTLCLPFSIALTNIALGAVSVALAAWCLCGGGLDWKRLRHPVVYAFLLYAAVGVLSSASGVNFSRSIGDWHKDLHKVWVAALMLLAGSAVAAPGLAELFALGLAAAAAIGVFQSAVFFLREDGYARAHAFIHPVSYGEMMAVAALGGLCYFSLARGRSKRWALAFLALSAVAALLSGSRGAMLGLAAGWAAAMVLRPAPWRRALAELLIAGLAVFASFHLRGEALPSERLLTQAAASAPAQPNSSQEHVILWGVAMRAFREHPWLGVGPANYRTVFPLYHPEPLEGEHYWSSAHNMYLQALAERGLFGLAALLGVLAALTFSAWKNLKRRSAAVALWACAAACGFWVMNATETAFQTEQVMTAVIFLWGLSEIRSRPETI